jgi:hypothetical protein
MYTAAWINSSQMIRKHDQVSNLPDQLVLLYNTGGMRGVSYKRNAMFFNDNFPSFIVSALIFQKCECLVPSNICKFLSHFQLSNYTGVKQWSFAHPPLKCIQVTTVCRYPTVRILSTLYNLLGLGLGLLGIKGKISSNCVMENYTKKGMTKFIGHSYKNRVNCWLVWCCSKWYCCCCCWSPPPGVLP